MMENVSALHSFLWLNNIPLYASITSGLPTHPLIDRWVVFNFKLLWIILLWIFMYKYAHIFSLLLHINLAVESDCAILHPHGQYVRVTCSPHPCHPLLSSVLLSIIIPVVWRSISWFWSAFPSSYDVEDFHVLIGHFCIFFEDMSIQNVLPILVRLSVFLFLSCKEFFTYSSYKFLLRYVICIYFLELYRLSFHFLDGVLWNKIF